MNTIRLTQDNAFQYVGRQIIFKTRINHIFNHIIRRIITVSETGKSVEIEYPDLDNRLQIISRNVYVILD